ncbi:hypothetical protein FRB93_000894 [Tulasnella sp. JGI-2019a]|nr:hypothetical protein FRB93_000894 [Tulasnella sp. JGI-2019a]
MIVVVHRQLRDKHVMLCPIRNTRRGSSIQTLPVIPPIPLCILSDIALHLTFNMPYLTKACEGDDCMLGSCVQHDADIRNTTTTFADAHELPPPYASSSSEHTTIVARTVRLWVSIQSEPDHPNYNLAAIHDICLLYSDEKTKQDLAECGNIFIIITDVSDIDIHLKDCFHDVHATVCIIRPTRRHVEFGVRYAAGVLRPGDECTMWFGCFGGLEVNKLQLVDSSALVTGTELLRWMTEHTNPQALIQVILDVRLASSLRDGASGN